MNKNEFLSRVCEGLSGLPKEDVKERLEFLGEMIDDRMEDGITEEEAVGKMGTVEENVSQIIADYPLSKLVKEKITSNRKLKVWEIILLVIGSPLWLSLLIALTACLIAFYAAIWCVIIALWAVFASVVACGISFLAAGICFAVKGNILTGIAVFGAGLVCVGLCVFLFFACKTVAKCFIKLTGKFLLGVKNLFVKKENA